MPDERKYKYLREDFGELTAHLDHLTIYLNFLNDGVEAANCLQMTAGRDLDSIALDACDLEIRSVEWCTGPGSAGDTLHYDYLTQQNRLIVFLPRKILDGETFFVRTITVCHPSDFVLEGIYKDVTPPGAPQQYMSQ